MEAVIAIGQLIEAGMTERRQAIVKILQTHSATSSMKPWKTIR